MVVYLVWGDDGDQRWVDEVYGNEAAAYAHVIPTTNEKFGFGSSEPIETWVESKEVKG